MMDNESEAMHHEGTAAAPIRMRAPEKKLVKTFTRLPVNYSELSEGERNGWSAEASRAILESLQAHIPDRSAGQAD